MNTSQQTDIHSSLGRITHKMALPLMRPVIRRTQRVYVLIESDGEILLIKNWFGRQDWHLPGGGKKRGETIYQAAAREAREETGILLPLDGLKTLTEGTWRTDRLGFKYSILCIKLKARPELALKKPEILEARWWKPEDTSMAMPTEIKEAIKSFYRPAKGKRR
jgi:8-oxo-dGTP pyrophosphatase MutT (NUDIX family)